jgi:hypothetical protein
MFNFANSRSISALSVIASLSVLSLSGLAAPAQASEQIAKQGEEQMLMTMKKRNGRTLYCLDQAITGSRIPAHSCYTKSEWEHRGAYVHDDTRHQEHETRSAEANKKSDGRS